MAVYQRPCKRRECQEKKSCKHAHWCYDFCINNVRYFGAIKEARTKPQAEQAEIRIKNDVFEGTYGSHKEDSSGLQRTRRRGLFSIGAR